MRDISAKILKLRRSCGRRRGRVCELDDVVDVAWKARREA